MMVNMNKAAKIIAIDYHLPAGVLDNEQLAAELGEGKNIVTVLCDTGERYFSLDEYFPGVSADDVDLVDDSANHGGIGASL